MRIDRSSAAALDYLPCRYGHSRLLCRGPKRALNRPYLLCLGSSTTYGKFVTQPFPDRVEQILGRACVNMGSPNAGIDSFASDPDVLSIANDAELTVVEVMGAQNLSNRFYRVHARRNDRFLSASPMLQTIYREVDFTEFSFNKHMLGHLKAVSPDRFELVQSELQQAWLARMRLLLTAIRSNVVLLWLQPAGPEGSLGADPLFVTADMIAALQDVVLDAVRVPLPDIGQPDDMDGMIYGDMESPAAIRTPGIRSHAQIAEALGRALRKHL